MNKKSRGKIKYNQRILTFVVRIEEISEAENFRKK